MEGQDKGKQTTKKWQKMANTNTDGGWARTRYCDGKSQGYLPHCQEPTFIIGVNWPIHPSIGFWKFWLWTFELRFLGSTDHTPISETWSSYHWLNPRTWSSSQLDPCTCASSRFCIQVLVHHLPWPASWLGICGSTAEYAECFSFMSVPVSVRIWAPLIIFFFLTSYSECPIWYHLVHTNPMTNRTELSSEPTRQELEHWSSEETWPQRHI